MTVYGYTRVSTVEQANDGNSLDTQSKQIAGYAMMKGWEGEPIILVEAGVSGSVRIAERPEGARLIGLLQPGDAVVVAKLDRMFRSAVDALDTLATLKEMGVSLHMIDLGGDVTGNGIGKLVFTILAAVAESERDRLRERIREVKRHMISEGLHHGGRRPFGYQVVDGKYVADVHEQEVVACLKDWRGVGMTYQAIADKANLAWSLSFHPMQVKRIVERRAA